MSDCIHTSDEETKHPTQELVRSSSASSSSSFDSCSDLLGSLEHAEKSLDDPMTCAHTEFHENEPKCGVEDDDICDQALQSVDVPAGVVLEQTTKESSLMPVEVVDDSVKMEGLSIKDHVYGLSNAITFSKMRSLAENTVERISQLQTTFRLPTSYIFPLKNVVPANNPLPPDATTDVQTEASNPCEEQPADGKGNLGEVLNSNSNTEGTALTDTNSLLQKEVVDVLHMPCGSLSDKSYVNMGSDDTHTEGFSSEEKVGTMEHTSTPEEISDPFSEKLSASNSTPVVDTIDVSSKGLLGINCMPAKGINDVLRKHPCTKNTVGNTRMIAIDCIPVVGTNDKAYIDVFGNSDTISSNSLGTDCVPTKDALSMLVGDTGTSYVATIDASANESRLTGQVKLVTSGNDTPTIDACSRNSTNFAGSSEVRNELSSDSGFKGLAPHASSTSEQSVTLTQTSKHSDLDVATPEITPPNASGLDIVPQDAFHPSDYVKQVSGEDSDLLELENSIMSFDLQRKDRVICHPLRTLSSGCGRPDLEEVDGIALGNKQSFGWNAASTKVGMLVNGHPFELFNSAPNSAPSALRDRPCPPPLAPDTLSSVELHSRVDHKADMPWPSSLDRKTYVPKGNHTSSSFSEQGLQVASSSASNNLNEGSKVLWNDRSILAEALEELQSNFFSEELSCGEILHEDRWKGLNVRLERNFNEREEKEDLGPDELYRYVENLELNETYVDTVLDMEDVLLDYDENGNRERFLLASSNSVIGTPRSSRDGSLSSSTSGLQLLTLTSGDCTPFTVDWVEVVGAKQRKGGSSFGERIVGVKDHTVYCIKVSSGSREWEVLRRYRDFVDLYHQLRRKFNVRTERSLPSPWKEVDRDSRKVFGSTHPNVIEIRSTRIEKCLQSLLQAGPPLSTSSPLYWFLRPQSTSKTFSGREGNHLIAFPASQKGLDVQLGTIESPCIQSPRSEVGSFKSELDHDKSSLALGKTVKLNLKIHPNKNLKQHLSAQHHSCAGCYKHLEVERGLVQGFVQTLGWGKPRLCEYSGQLYCASCHLNETAVLPAQVLWHWDFTPRRVSQLAKAYLDSIYDQPMLCVSAVNPYLYSRVPILSHVKETRKKLSKMLSCMLCPSRARIFQTMASRRYLMENNDFFALRDLEDLSKGAFAVLPGLLTAVMESLRLHITKQCSVCSETGDWCGAGILCEEPFSPIFPFQEEGIAICKVCHAPFHKVCFSRYKSCPACPKDQSKRLGLTGDFEHPQMEEVSEDHRDALPLLGGQDVTTSPPSIGETDLQDQLVTDKQSHSYRNWPSFYHLLPKKRLW